ncbi:MAG: 23S rRNA (guanosine(2251)-2'-O)-methyltransferase RlmB [Pseudomonadaceae bacterium]|nr:23S rRNA (guanosine(2251)-2'-O)-methyltransferase RlmB [Pseudomonadaceae bacterium]
MSGAVVSGRHAVTELLQREPDRVRALLVQKGRASERLQDLIELARSLDIRVDFADRARLDRMSEANHQGVVAQVQQRKLADESEFESRFASFDTPLILVLDEIEDPRNLGACLRSADAAGVDAVLVPERRSAPLSEAAAKAASGAESTVFLVQVTNLARRLEWLKEQGVWLIGTDGDAEQPWHQVDMKGSVALVLGSEGKGMRRLTREACDFTVSVPMAGAVSSLNVSVAAGIMLFEAVRQRSLA